MMLSSTSSLCQVTKIANLNSNLEHNLTQRITHVQDQRSSKLVNIVHGEYHIGHDGDQEQDNNHFQVVSNIAVFMPEKSHNFD
jgi:hypothetical protein